MVVMVCIGLSISLCLLHPMGQFQMNKALGLNCTNHLLFHSLCLYVICEHCQTFPKYNVPDMNVDELDWYWFADGSCFSWRIDF